MSKPACVATLVALLVALTGCGSAEETTAGSKRPATPSGSATCRGDSEPTALTRADLDGDGALDDLSLVPKTGDCPATLTSSVRGLESGAAVAWDDLPSPKGAAAVQLPGRTGELVLLLERHPRGGFQAHLVGYADGELAELTVDRRPVLPFVATDVPSDPMTARCVDGGLEVTRAVAHEPIGVVPAWDVVRTTYAVDGNDVSAGPTTEIADNVLDEELDAEYPELVQHVLLEDCRTAG